MKKLGFAALVLAGALLAGMAGGCSGHEAQATLEATVAAAPTAEPSAEPPPIVPPVRLEDPVLPGVFADGLDVDWQGVDTSSWAVYENLKYGYSFRYPVAWTIKESDSDGMPWAYGQMPWPVQSVDLQNPADDWGKDCSKECIPSPPGFLELNVAITSERCGWTGTRIVLDRFSFEGGTADRCVLLGWNDNEQARVTLLAFPYELAGVNRTPYLVVSLQRGDDVTPEQQATLEAILHSFRRVPQSLHTLTPPP